MAYNNNTMYNPSLHLSSMWLCIIVVCPCHAAYMYVVLFSSDFGTAYHSYTSFNILMKMNFCYEHMSLFSSRSPGHGYMDNAVLYS